MEEKIVLIINEMADYLNVSQMKKLQEVLLGGQYQHGRKNCTDYQ